LKNENGIEISGIAGELADSIARGIFPGAQVEDREQYGTDYHYADIAIVPGAVLCACSRSVLLH